MRDPELDPIATRSLIMNLLWINFFWVKNKMKHRDCIKKVEQSDKKNENWDSAGTYQ